MATTECSTMPTILAPRVEYKTQQSLQAQQWTPTDLSSSFHSYLACAAFSNIIQCHPNDISKHQYGSHSTALQQTSSQYRDEVDSNMKKLHVWANCGLFLPRQKPWIKEKHPEKQRNGNWWKRRKWFGEQEGEGRYGMLERTPVATDLSDPLLIQWQVTMRLDL